MKSFIVCFMIGAATAAQLPNSYIPPSSQSAGGSQFLQTPFADQFNNQGPYPASGGSKSQDAQATILKYDNQPNAGDGSYSYSFETSNGIKVDEQGYNTQQGPENSEQVVTGSYSYVENGKTYTVTYKADANGFQAQGDHLPTPPPIPEAIQKSLDYIARQNQQNGYADSQQTSQSYLPPNQVSFDTQQQGYRY